MDGYLPHHLLVAGMTYVPADYWAKRGKVYEGEARKAGWWTAGDEPLFDLLDKLEFRSVLEVGCGFGRVGDAILKRWPEVSYTGIDVSPDLCNAAQMRLPDHEIICADLATWKSPRKWDLVVSVSVLGHLLPTDIAAVIAKMRKWARNDVIHIDWDEVGASTSFQFGHDYRAIDGDALISVTPYGRQSMFHVAPWK